MRMNTARAPARTHEGATASTVSAIDTLRRTVLSCMLWEQNFYEDGETVANRIQDLVPRCAESDVKALALQARTEYRLRHAPLWLLLALARTGAQVKDVLAEVIQRPDEMAELLALYWKDGRRPLPAQLKKGLALAFPKFDAYQLAKWDRGEIKLRDVMFLVHPKPKDDAQRAVWRKLANGALEGADTWERRLSGGECKTESFTALLAENRLGYMALLRNLRNMEGVDPKLIRTRLMEGAARSKALPFRFIAAAKAAPRFEDTLDGAMQLALNGLPMLEGETIVLVDVSASMRNPLSERSEMTRIEATTALAILLCGVCESARVFTFSNELVEIPPRKSLALHGAVLGSQPMRSTYMGAAVKKAGKSQHDRMIVITDEQSHDRVPAPRPGVKGYILNIAPYEYGVGYGPWTHINGFSEASVRFIHELER